MIEHQKYMRSAYRGFNFTIIVYQLVVNLLLDSELKTQWASKLKTFTFTKT